MADYLWSPVKVAKKDGSIEVLPVGESVTRDKLNTTKEHYEELKAVGTIREQKFPKDVQGSESVRERNIRVLTEGLKEAETNMYSEMPDLSVDETSHLVAREVETPSKG